MSAANSSIKISSVYRRFVFPHLQGWRSGDGASSKRSAGPVGIYDYSDFPCYGSPRGMRIATTPLQQTQKQMFSFHHRSNCSRVLAWPQARIIPLSGPVPARALRLKQIQLRMWTISRVAGNSDLASLPDATSADLRKCSSFPHPVRRGV